MSGRDLGEHWQSIYAGQAPDEVSWFQRRPQLSLRLIRSTGCGPAEPIIDVGGGASRLVDCLLKRGFTDLSVLDLSPTALQVSRERLGSHARKVRWLETDLLDFEPTRRYRVWHDRALFHFLTRKPQRRRYVRILDQALAADGQAIIAAFSTDGPRRCSGLRVRRYDADSLMADLGPVFELLQTVTERHRTPSGAVQHFIWFRLRRAAEARAS